MSILEFLGAKPTLPKFADRLMKALPAEERGQWRFDAGKGALVRSGGAEISLHNMFLEYSRSAVSARSDLIQKYASLAHSHVTEIPDLWIAAAPNLLPTVRSQFVEMTIAVRSRMDGSKLDPLEFPFAGDLRVRLMYDFGDYMGYVRAEKLRTWGQSPEAVLERALANLGRLEEPQWMEVGPGLFKLESAVSFEESMVQLDSVRRMLPFANDALLMPCNRGILLAADGRSDAAIEAMLLEAEQALEAPWPMTSTIFRKSSSGWEVVDPPKSCSNLAHGLVIRHAAEFYSAQKEALDALHEALDNDVYVAEYTVIRVDGQWQSYCVWAQGVHALLPVADWVALLPEGEDSKHIQVGWKDVLEVCGGRMSPTTEDPPRFRVDSFPSDEEWTALKSRAMA